MRGCCMWRSVRWISGGVVGFGLGGLLVLAIITARTKLPGEEMTPAGIRQSTSEYVKMRDGLDIAVTVDLPADLKRGERVPVRMRTTRCWREPQIRWTLRMLVAFVKLVLPRNWKTNSQHISINATSRCSRCRWSEAGPELRADLGRYVDRVSG